MFESILGALLAHKHIVIAAIAITGIGVYAFPFNALNLNQAQADHATIANHIQTVEIPCPVQYCNVPDTQETIVENPLDENAPPIVHIRISFISVPLN
jgi:hypothetical protein